MRKLPILVLVLSASLMAGQNATRVSYDRFEDKTTISAPDLELTPPVPNKVRFSYTCPGDKSDCRPETVLMTFNHTDYWTSGWCCAGSPVVIFLADDARILPAHITWKGDTDDEALAETTPGAIYSSMEIKPVLSSKPASHELVTATVTVEEYIKLAAAKAVELKIGDQLKPFKLKVGADWWFTFGAQK